ncbi:MAG: DUF2860 domain-containing protein [Caulobacterales bacterium]|nr:DUF2860 domain-containing protein [Caulobacterales bacterium]
MTSSRAAIRPRGPVAAAALLCAAAPWPAVAQLRGDSPPWPVEIEVSGGVEYDSNVSVNELDANTGDGDIAAIFEVDIDYERDLGENTELDLAYGVSQSLFQDLDDFNLQIHLATADISHDFGGVDVGGAYRLAYSRLGGEGFLTIQQLSPYVSTFLTKSLFLRADYTYADKNFQTRDRRDADTHAIGGDLYYFLNGVRSYVILGYDYETTDSVGDEFDFSAHNAKVRYSRRIAMRGRDAELKLGWRFETRDYDAVTPSIGEVRDDDRHRLEAELELPLTDRVYALTEYEYGAFSSNLPSADFNQNVASARLGMRF